jgi:urea transporter
MKAAKILRLAVIAELTLIPIGIAVSYWADSLLPREIITLEENHTTAFSVIEAGGAGMTAFTAASLLLLFGSYIASVIGLLLLKRWGAWLYLFGAILSLPLHLLTGFEVLHPVDLIFDGICQFTPGFIIALAFFTDAIPKRDREPCA